MRVVSVVLVIALGVAAGTVGGAPRLHRIAGGTFEASGVVHVPGTDGVLFVDDARTRTMLWMDLSVDGTQEAPAVEVPIPNADIVDLEAMTTDGRHFYAVGSQSKEVGFDGDGLVRFAFDPATRRISNVETVRDLKRFLGLNVAELRGVERQIGDEALNIEGLAWDPTHNRLLLGLRAPVKGANALIVPVKLREPEGPFSADNLIVDTGGTITLPLGGVGLRSIEYDPIRGAFLIITGAALNEESSDFRLLEWNGRDKTVREIGRYSRRLKPEGIARAKLGGADVTVIVFDTGMFEVVRDQGTRRN